MQKIYRSTGSETGKQVACSSICFNSADASKSSHHSNYELRVGCRTGTQFTTSQPPVSMDRSLVLGIDLGWSSFLVMPVMPPEIVLQLSRSLDLASCRSEYSWKHTDLNNLGIE